MFEVSADLRTKRDRDELVALLNDSILAMKQLDTDVEDEERALPEHYSPLVKDILSFGIRAEAAKVIVTVSPRSLADDAQFAVFVRALIEKAIQRVMYKA